MHYYSAEESRQSTVLNKAVQTLAQDISAKPDKSDELSEQVARLRSDEFERSYAMKWLTGLIARSEEWIEFSADADSHELDPAAEPRNREKVIEQASALLAACAGSTASGALTRSFTYHPHFSHPNSDISGNLTPAPIQIHLKDDPLPAQDHTAVGLQTWGSAPILAQLVSENPRKYGLDLYEWIRRHSYTGMGMEKQLGVSCKVLELGAGTGLLSLFTWRLLEHQTARHPSNSIPLSAAVTATDFHPSVLSNLNFNLSLNPPSQTTLESASRPSASIDAKFLDWNSCVSLDDNERFDIVFGADIIYEKEHAQLIKSVVEKVLKRPASRSDDGERAKSYPGYNGGVFWLIYPLRPTHEVETESIEKEFGEVVDASRWAEDATVASINSGKEQDWSLGVLEIQSLERRKGIGRADEVSYRVLKIGWVRA
jgi:protein-lysine N-methyltransferase EEF2KMT